MLAIWTQFLLCVGLIWLAGVRLSRYGDVIAEKTDFSRGWIGLVLLATATSLPELVTGVSAVTLAGAPDIAVGDALGSCVFNLLLITVLDFLQRGEPGALDLAIANLFGSNLFDVLIIAIDDVLFLPGPILTHVSPLHAVTSFSAVMMTGVAIVGLLYRPTTRLFRAVGWTSLLLFSLYLLNVYVVFLHRG